MKGKAKNLSTLKAPKNPHKVRVSMSHVGGHAHLGPTGTKKRGKKRGKKSLRKA
jgi:hypothetical protein